MLAELGINCEDIWFGKEKNTAKHFFQFFLSFFMLLIPDVLPPSGREINGQGCRIYHCPAQPCGSVRKSLRLLVSLQNLFKFKVVSTVIRIRICTALGLH